MPAVKNILVTGGAGFIGSHVVEHYAQKGHQVVVLDNISRLKLLSHTDKEFTFNWDYFENLDNVELVNGDIRNKQTIDKIAERVDVIVHAAAQTAVTTSVVDPETDFTVNVVGSFNVLEAARKSKKKPAVILCSTNKVYGKNINQIPVTKSSTRYIFKETSDSGNQQINYGISENFPIDLTEHTPYGCSKLTSDIYTQDYAHLYGIKTGVFRMSCIYGTRQYGVEDQGWVAWFTIATLLGKDITIYGDGRQVRDVLYVSDLVEAFDAFLNSSLSHGVFNLGGGPENTLSLLELLDMLEEYTGKRSRIRFADWRPGDQKVYISDIRKAKELLGWSPTVPPRDGVKRLVHWAEENIAFLV